MHVGGLHLRRNDYIITIGSERNHTMMTFNQSETHSHIYKATNSIKPVEIYRMCDGKFMIYTPEGRLLDDFTSAGPFVDFESAKRNAETNVGMKMNWENF